MPGSERAADLPIGSFSFSPPWRDIRLLPPAKDRDVKERRFLPLCVANHEWCEQGLPQQQPQAWHGILETEKQMGWGVCLSTKTTYDSSRFETQRDDCSSTVMAKDSEAGSQWGLSFQET